jgi:hypothetical protein
MKAKRFLLIILLIFASVAPFFANGAKITCQESGDRCVTGVCSEASYGSGCIIFECRLVGGGVKNLNCNTGMFED